MKRLLLAVKLIITAASIYYLYHLVEWQSIWQSLTRTNPLWIGAACLTTLTARYVAALQLRYLTDAQAMNLSTGAIFHINLTTSFYQLFLPGYLSGGAVRWYKLSRANDNDKGSEALGVIILNRLLDVGITLWLGLLGWNIHLFDSNPDQAEILLAVNGLLLLLAAGGYRLRHQMINWLNRYDHRLVTDSSAFPGKYWKQMIAVALRFDQLKGRHLLSIVGMILIIHTIASLTWFGLAEAAGLGVSLVDIVWVRAVVVIMTLLPISISGLGVREASLVILMAPLGVDANDVIVFSVLLFSLKLIYGLLGGLVEVITMGWHYRKSRQPGHSRLTGSPREASSTS